MDMVQAVIERNDGFFFDMANKAADVDHFIKADVLEWIGVMIEMERERSEIARQRDEDNKRDAEYWENYAEYQRDLMADLWWGRI
ncbi:MAG: hypothetical protein HQL58_09635 [Magnetococcales bacterium]|nr:hypothetical protein [Magnetococcales bacterium]